MRLLLIALLAVATVTADAAIRDAYSNEAFGFTVTFPTGMSVVESKSGVDDFSVTATGGDSASTWQCAVRLAFVDSDTTAESLASQSIAKIREQEGYTFRRRFVGKLGGKVGGVEVPGIAADIRAGAITYRVHAFFKVRDGVRTIVQITAPVSEFTRHATAFNAFLRSFVKQPIDAQQRYQRRLAALSTRCGSELAWASDWNDAVKKAREQGKLILVAAQFFRGFEMPDVHGPGALFDADIQALIESRFVPFKLTAVDQFPLSAPSRYGLGPHALGAAFLVVASSGVVIRETPATSVVTVDDFLRETLRSTADAAQPGERTGLALARWHAARGELSEATAVAADTPGSEARLLQATIHRRLRQGDAAIAQLELAKVDASKSALRRIALEESQVLAGTGQPEAAAKRLNGAINAGLFADSDLAAEADVRLASLLLETGDRAGAEAYYHGVIRRSPEDRWSWLAAAIVTGPTFEHDITPSSAWPSDDVMAAVRVPSPSRATINRSATGEALTYLLERQQEDGSWPHPYHAAQTAAGEQNPIAEAIVAIAAHALLPHREKKLVRAAIDRTLERIQKSNRDRATERVHFMDFWVWTKCYELRFVAECLAHGIGSAEDLAALGRTLAAALVDKQRPSGGWSYYVTGDLRSSEQDTGSISFVTSSVCLALLRAKEAGIDVTQESIDRGLLCLESMRVSPGLYAYHGSIGASPPFTAPASAAGRGPAVALALHRGGRCDTEELRRALRLFVEHREGLAREQGKSLMHAGPHGQGSHYVLFDYAGAAEAIAALPTDQQREFAPPILDLIARARTSDGGYIDMPGIGRVFGTAAALEIYTHLVPLVAKR